MLGDLGKLIVAKGFKSCPKSNKSLDMVTLAVEGYIVSISVYPSDVLGLNSADLLVF